jgi:soluble lytic murein transglycosylase
MLVPQGARAWSDEPLCAVPQFSANSDDDVEDALGMCAPSRPHLLRSPGFDACAPMSGRDAAEDAPLVAARALKRARELEKAGLYEDALLNLRVVEATMPRVADHIALMRATLNEALGDATRAATAYHDAMERSENRDLAARAYVGYVRNLLRAGVPSAERELNQLLARYPELPEAADLKLEHARYRETIGMLKVAAATYRQLDLTLPGYPVAKRARERLEVLAAQGVSVAPYSDLEALQRTERLLKSGPIELARGVVAEVAARPMPKALLGQRDALVQTMAEIEVRHATGPGPMVFTQVTDEVARQNAEKRLRAQIADKKKLAKARPFLVAQLLDTAAELRLADVADELVRELTRRAAVCHAELRFEALTNSAGAASDLELVALADTLVAHPTYGVAARYHRARALERAGQLDAAKQELVAVTQLDSSATRFYATWASQRLRALGERRELCDAPGRVANCNQERIEAALRALEQDPGVNVEAALTRLDAVAAQHGEAYPWLRRAADLLRLGEIDAASDELHQAYLAYRFVTRRGALRSGRQAVYRGTSVVLPTVDANLRRQRLMLDEAARSELARVASDIGDWGTAAYFGGPGYAESQPFAYGQDVARVARKYGLDPDLLFAVMRVESVYQRRIISHAGAIGLMQIMPRTGRLIADKLGQHQATTTDLLDPRTNLEFSAWYLRSLLERMDGRLPLAIAGYNGGPHNVRKWIRSYGVHVPLDAFLERIPFTETKRYVRRVLGYYARYKAQRGEQIDLMAVTLPGEKVTEVAF